MSDAARQLRLAQRALRTAVHHLSAARLDAMHARTGLEVLDVWLLAGGLIDTLTPLVRDCNAHVSQMRAARRSA